MDPFILPLIGAAAGGLLNKKNRFAGAALGALGGSALGGAMPGLLGSGAASGAAGASGATGGLLSTAGIPNGAIAMGSSMVPSSAAASTVGIPTGPMAIGSGMVDPSATAGIPTGQIATGGLLSPGASSNSSQPWMQALKTGMEMEQPEEPMQPSPLVLPQGSPQAMVQLQQSIQQDAENRVQRFPQRVRRY